MAERFHIGDERFITVYDTEGLFQIVDSEEAIVIDDLNKPQIMYVVFVLGNVIVFDVDILEQTGVASYSSQTIWTLSLLLAEWDILILDLYAEIFITRNYDVYRLPFRYLLLSRSEDDLCRDLEFLGNYQPTTTAQEQVEIRGRLYDLNEWY